MFDYTTVALQKIKSDFLKAIFVFSVLSQCIYVAYLIYALVAGAGNVWVNAVLLVLSGGYLPFYLVMYWRESTGAKNTKKIVSLVYKRSKQVLKLYTLAMSVYTICITTANVDHFSVLITTFMLITFILQILLEIVYRLVVSRLQFLIEGVKADIEPISKAVKSTNNFFKRLKGEEIEPEAEKTKQRLWLDEKVQESRAEKAAKKLAAKQERKEKKQRRKEE
ncbi:MAG: hypothetical protein J6B56_02285 [Clostridia bacterium]|nr:hypothetical protein [Clostridia bacterium]